MESKYLKTAPTGVAYATSGSIDTNSTTTPVDKLDKTAPGLDAGDYKISFYAEAKTDTPGTSRCKLEILLDGVGKAEANIESAYWQQFSGSAIIPFNENDTPRVQLQFSRQGAAATVSIRRANLSLKPMAKVTS